MLRLVRTRFPLPTTLSLLPTTPYSTPPATPYTALDAMGLDIGGTLSKLVFFEPNAGWLGDAVRSWRRLPSYDFVTKEPQLSLRTQSGVLRCSRFKSSQIDQLISCLADYADQVRSHTDGEHTGRLGERIPVTGGGAYKFKSQIESHFARQHAPVVLDPLDEMEALAAGFRFLMDHHGPAKQSYWYTLDEASQTRSPRIPLEPEDAARDAILVNIGSGVSVLHLDGGPSGIPQRISGSSIGGSTFWGLARLLTQYTSFDEAIAGAEQGSRDSVAMLVSDIYGAGYNSVGLDGSIVAADFGKMATSLSDPKQTVSDTDLARATLVLVLNNIAQIATMNAQKYGVSNIFFMGGLLRPGLMEDILVSGTRFWSQNTIKPAFSHHQNYLGALGALVANARTRSPDSLAATHIRSKLTDAPGE